MGLRRKSRELALQFLYQHELNPIAVENHFDAFCSHFGFQKKTIPFALSLVLGVIENYDAIDDCIIKCAHNWRLSRMATVDRNILRIAAYELLFQSETPSSVVIDEAIEIAHNFSDPDSGSFINGVLDAIRIMYPNGFS